MRKKSYLFYSFRLIFAFYTKTIHETFLLEPVQGFLKIAKMFPDSFLKCTSKNTAKF